MRTYSELISLRSFSDRYEYLKLTGEVGASTFGFDRYLNQIFYRLKEWKHVRNEVILRDNGCDLGIEGYEIQGNIFVHHMNPITKNDVLHNVDYVLNPEYLICASFDTHNAIHFGRSETLFNEPIERTPNDTCLWRK